ncbi:DUF1336-containing protein [Aureococcus anophagefferens]|nr:DUF1336-containing protein [Aureococcus anophagefferens]
MILQGELLLRTKKKSELSWARGFFVLAVEDRTLFCFGPGGPGLERPRCVVRLSGARVSRVAADDALYKFTIARGSLASRCGELWSRTIACACVAAGALAQYGYVRCAASLLGATARCRRRRRQRRRRARWRRQGAARRAIRQAGRGLARGHRGLRRRARGRAGRAAAARGRSAQPATLASETLRCAVSVRASREEVLDALSAVLSGDAGGGATLCLPRRQAEPWSGDDLVSVAATRADDGFVLSPAYAGGCAESLSGRLRVSAKERWDGVDLEAEIRATSARPVAPKRLEAIGERALLLCLVAKDKAEAAKFVDVSARALDDLRGLGPAAKAWDDGAPSDGDGDGYVLLGGGTCQGLRVEPPLFELVAADLLLHGDGDGAHPPPGADAAGGAPAPRAPRRRPPENRVRVARDAYAAPEAGAPPPFTFVVTLVVPGPPSYTYAMYYACRDSTKLRDGSTPLGRVAEPFFFGDDDAFRDDRFKMTPRVVDANWVVRRAVGQNPVLLGKKLKQHYFRGPDYLELDIDIASSAVAASVVRLCGGYAKALVVDISYVLEAKHLLELPESVLGTIQIAHMDVDKGVPLPR